MFSRLKDFETVWIQEFHKTQKVFKHIPDKALGQAVGKDGRSLAQLAWHITVTIPEMMSQTGIAVSGPAPADPVPQSMMEIRQAYERAGLSVLEEIKSKWTDATLEVSDAMYGQMWKRSYTLAVLVFHQIHHRAQMTVLMRQAGLPVPGLYGPAREEWAQWGMPVPLI